VAPFEPPTPTAFAFTGPLAWEGILKNATVARSWYDFPREVTGLVRCRGLLPQGVVYVTAGRHLGRRPLPAAAAVLATSRFFL
jgi:hypothetical protein